MKPMLSLLIFICWAWFHCQPWIFFQLREGPTYSTNIGLGEACDITTIPAAVPVPQYEASDTMDMETVYYDLETDGLGK